MKAVVEKRTSNEAWLAAMLVVARHYRVDCSEEGARVAMAWSQGLTENRMLERLAHQIGLEARFVAYSEGLLDPWRLPVVAEFSGGQVGVIESFDGDGLVGVKFSGDQGLASSVRVDSLKDSIRRVVILRPASSVPDARVDEYIKPYQANWFWKIALKDWRRYLDVALASLGANVLALAGIIFSMQVYDRVVPAQSEPTLWVLFGGVMLAIVFEFSFRVLRTVVSDTVGKRTDLQISDLVFGHVLRIRNDARPKSTGAFIAQVRELEQLRELVTSTTIGVIADLPFFLLFLGIVWLIGGQLAWVPVVAILVLIASGLLVQKPLARLSNEGMRESSIRNALLVESIQGIEDIKQMRAEPRVQAQWNYLNEVSADIGIKQRFISGVMLTWTQEIQSIVFASVLLFGAYLVMSGDMTTGALVGMSILSSRMLAPIAQLSGVFTRWQQAKVARKGLDELMQRPIDQPERSKRIHRPVVRGAYELIRVCFDYGGEKPKPAIQDLSLSIRPGEKIAVLGRNGAGKSTLLQLLAGMREPVSGQLNLDGLTMNLIDTADVRRDIGMLSQNATLFFGTLRENLTMGAPHASDQDMLDALLMSGADSFVQALPGGLDYMIQEGGSGLSGGQRQAILLARLFIRQPNVVLLDEPTAWLDVGSEQQLIGRLEPWLQGRTLVVATHRMAVLKLVDRIVVVDDGRIAADGPRDEVIARLSANNERGK